jgi:hypothetical protein
MTNNEAIEEIRKVIWYDSFFKNPVESITDTNNKYIALNMAIEALKQSSLLDYIMECIDAEKTAITEYPNLADEEYHKGIIHAFESIKRRLCNDKRGS